MFHLNSSPSFFIQIYYNTNRIKKQEIIVYISCLKARGLHSYLTKQILDNINFKLINFSAHFDPEEQDILVTDHHHNQFRLKVNDQAERPVDRLKYLNFDNSVINNTVELTNNNQLGDYLVCLNLIHSTIINYKKGVD